MGAPEEAYDRRMYTLRNTIRRPTTIAVALALLAVLIILGAKAGGADPLPITDPGQASGDGVQPQLYQDNPKCSDLGNYRDVKFDFPPVAPGTKTSGDGYLTATISNITPEDQGAGQVFDWTTNRGVDKVIVKGGDAADAYVYDPEDRADTKLHAPVNPNTERYFGLSHIDFCYNCYVPQRWYTKVRLRCLGGLGDRPHTHGRALRFSCRVATLVARSIS